MQIIAQIILAILEVSILTIIAAIVYLLFKYRVEIKEMIWELRERPYRNHGRRYFYGNYEEIDSFIRYIERERNIRLTHAAKELLVLPIIEALNQDDLDPKIRDRYLVENWQKSISIIIDNMVKSPAYFDRRNSEFNRFSSQSVIKAFAERFCNIPPFCGETDRR